jgi:predicted Zn-dependent protease
MTHLLDGEDPSEAVKPLEHAVKLRGTELGVQLQLARAYLAVGREEDARPILRRITSSPHASEIGREAREILAELNGGDSAPLNP